MHMTTGAPCPGRMTTGAPCPGRLLTSVRPCTIITHICRKTFGLHKISELNVLLVAFVICSKWLRMWMRLHWLTAGADPWEEIGVISPQYLGKLLYSPWFCTIRKTTFAIKGNFAVHCFVTSVLWSIVHVFYTGEPVKRKLDYQILLKSPPTPKQLAGGAG